MKVRIGVSARFHGTIELEVPDEEINGERWQGDVNAWAERGAEDFAQRALEEGADLNAEIDDLDVFNEETEKWEVVPEA